MPSGQSAADHRPDPERLWPSLIAVVREYALLLLDTDGRIVSSSLGVELIKGYKAEEIVGRHVSCFYSPEDIAAGIPSRELEIAAATGSFETVGERVRKDGTHFLANVVITAIREPDGALRGFGKITSDITARTAAEVRSQGQRGEAAQPDRHGAGYGGRRPDHHRPQPASSSRSTRPVSACSATRRTKWSGRTCAS